MSALSLAYLQGVLQLYNNSSAVYTERGILPSEAYPLLPTRALFRELKCDCISIVRQFRYCSALGAQLLTLVDVDAIDAVILNTHEKYLYFFNRYSIATVRTELDYPSGSEA
jgi:hypothetical protein